MFTLSWKVLNPSWWRRNVHALEIAQSLSNGTQNQERYLHWNNLPLSSEKDFLSGLTQTEKTHHS